MLSVWVREGVRELIGVWRKVRHCKWHLSTINIKIILLISVSVYCLTIILLISVSVYCLTSFSPGIIIKSVGKGQLEKSGELLVLHVLTVAEECDTAVRDCCGSNSVSVQ